MELLTSRLLIALAISVITGCTGTTTDDREHVAILFFDIEGRLQLEYEGTGYRQFCGIGHTKSPTGDSELEFRAIHYDSAGGVDIQDESLVDASFEGTYSMSGADERELSFRLSIANKVPLTIRLVGISKNASRDDAEPFEKRFEPGNSDFVFDGRVHLYYEAP